MKVGDEKTKGMPGGYAHRDPRGNIIRLQSQIFAEADYREDLK